MMARHGACRGLILVAADEMVDTPESLEFVESSRCKWLRVSDQFTIVGAGVRECVRKYMCAER